MEEASRRDLLWAARTVHANEVEGSVHIPRLG